MTLSTSSLAYRELVIRKNNWQETVMSEFGCKKINQAINRYCCIKCSRTRQSRMLMSLKKTPALVNSELEKAKTFTVITRDQSDPF